MLAPEQCRHQSNAATRKGLATRKWVQGGKVSMNETGREIVYQTRTQRDRLPVQRRLMMRLMQSWEGRTNMIAGKEVSCKLFWPRLKDETIKLEPQPIRCLF